MSVVRPQTLEILKNSRIYKFRHRRTALDFPAVV